jgi:hypothetical protein
MVFYLSEEQVRGKLINSYVVRHSVGLNNMAANLKQEIVAVYCNSHDKETATT